MSAVSSLKFLYLCYFSKPVGDRTIFRLIRKLKPAKILELGVGSGRRAQRMLETAQRYRPIAEMRYAGVDLFEARVSGADADRLSLKDAHVLLKTTGVRAQLVPGDPFSGLSRAANGLRDNDLVLISADQDADSLQRAWFYFPRMLHAQSVVLREMPVAASGTCWQIVPRDEIEQLAAQQQSRRRVA